MESISALMDGELPPDHAERELTRLKQDAASRETWDAFHLIGDAMRGNAALSTAFDRRFAERLAAEPTVLAPVRRRPRVPPAVSYALSAAASLSAVAVVAWVALSGSTADRTPNLAQAPAAAVAPPAVPSVPAVAEAGPTHDYLLAHQGVSPSTALQGVAPYVRTVTMSQQIDGR